ncbi:putative Rep protein [Circovirus-like genome DCCV-7]|uniref:putative Rep protein n=1 Tax=Circovirus-like genome DCCV-7 TaxID=1788447 RepID=UPI0007F9BDDB|nr:putative Rep protein [Circovirus-like genome DCCV-7]AMB42969.1 putative Rep protein [Circovirus-like genome DCCV-7]
MEPWQAQNIVGKESFGSSPSPPRTPSVLEWKAVTSLMDLSGVKARKKEVNQPVMNTTSSWSPLPRKCLYPELLECLEEAPMVNSQDQKLPTHMWEKKRLALESRLNLGLNRFGGTTKPIGTPYGPPPSPEISIPSPQISEWCLIMPCEQSDQTMPNLKPLKEEFMCFGVVQELENLVVLGMKREKVLTLSVHDPSFGMAIKIKNMLSLMNFEEVLMWRTCFDGLIVIRSVWKLKGARGLWLEGQYGSLRTWSPLVGTQV